MSMSDPVEALMALYPRIYFACHLRHRRDPATQEVLSAHQGSILDHLDAVDGTTVGDLAQHMGVTAATMSIHLGRLEARGFVTRERDLEDGRRVQVLLTSAGLRVKETNSVLDPALVAELFAQLDPAEQREALDGLALLARAAGEAMSRRSGARSVAAAAGE